MRLSMETLNLGLDYGIKEALRLMKDAGFDAADLRSTRSTPTTICSIARICANLPFRCANTPRRSA